MKTGDKAMVESWTNAGDAMPDPQADTFYVTMNEDGTLVVVMLDAVGSWWGEAPCGSGRILDWVTPTTRVRGPIPPDTPVEVSAPPFGIHDRARVAIAGDTLVVEYLTSADHLTNPGRWMPLDTFPVRVDAGVEASELACTFRQVAAAAEPVAAPEDWVALTERMSEVLEKKDDEIEFLENERDGPMTDQIVELETSLERAVKTLGTVVEAYGMALFLASGSRGGAALGDRGYDPRVGDLVIVKGTHQSTVEKVLGWLVEIDGTADVFTRRYRVKSAVTGAEAWWQYVRVESIPAGDCFAGVRDDLVAAAEINRAVQTGVVTDGGEA